MNKPFLVVLFLFSLSQSFAGEFSGKDAYGGCPEGLENKTTYSSDYILADVFLPSHMYIDLVVVKRREGVKVEVFGGENVKDASSLHCSQDILTDVKSLDHNILKHRTYGESVRFTGVYLICIKSLSGKPIESALLCNSNTGD